MAIFNLTPVHRILMLNGFFPEQGDYITLQRILKFKERVSFTEGEMDAWEIKTEAGTFTCNAQASDLEVEIGDVLHELIVNTLYNMNANKTLTVAHMGLYELFCPPLGVSPSNGQLSPDQVPV